MTPNPKTRNGKKRPQILKHGTDVIFFKKNFLINFLNNFLNFLKAWPPKYFSHLSHKSLKFFTTSPVPVRMSSQAFMVTGPCIASNYGS